MKILSSLKARKLARSIERNPGRFSGYKELISIHITDKNYADALSVIEQAEKRSWSSSETVWLVNQKLLIRRETDHKSLELIQDALKLIEDHSLNADLRMDTALIVLPELESKSCDGADDWVSRCLSAMQNLATAMPDHSGSIRILTLAAKISNQLNRHSDALEYIQKALASAQKQRDPDFGKLCLLAAHIGLKTKAGLNKVKSWFINALDSNSLSENETVEALTGLAEINRTEDDLLGAMERYEAALRFAGDRNNCQTARIRFQLACVNFALEKYPQAEKEALNALKVNCFKGEELIDLLIWLATLRELRGNIRDAFSNLDTALESADRTELKIRVLKRKAELQEKTTAYTDAIITLELALSFEDHQPDYELLLNLAHLYNLEGSYHKAIKLLKQINQDPKAIKTVAKSRILLESALAWLGRMKVVRALETLIQVIEISSPDEQTWTVAKRHLLSLKKELKHPEGVKKYQLDGSERKTVESLLAKIPEDDDLLTRLRAGLKKTRSGLIVGIERILKSRSVIDDDVLDEIEELMILSDLGFETTNIIITGLREKLVRHELYDADVVRHFIRSEIERILSGHSGVLSRQTDVTPHVIMVVGVNGVGKTTTIAKIARRFIDEGSSVLLAAADTFRAGAIEQLKEWGRRLETDVIAHREGADPSAVAWDAVAAAKNRNADVLIIDTAGRLHTKSNLMEELKKVRRVIDKNMPGAPHEVLLVLDATTGQNAVIQARQFCQTVNVSGIALTKLDGTAKGGIVVSIVQELKIPVKLIGIGERMDDLRDFEPSLFANALFDSENSDSTDTQA
jgi:fused signal recognition particle receptor